ncbi:hypothetical protein [Schlesneria sp. T3-172]|uniref:hypothetical protein n=1 Tax=Schlesneria sphaerica TaxID=3373610 RepID=UPI0037C9A9D9
MRSVFGPLMLVLLSLTAGGCMLPAPFGRAESLGDRPLASPFLKGSRKAKSESDLKSQSDISFRSPKTARGASRSSEDRPADAEHIETAEHSSGDHPGDSAVSTTGHASLAHDSFDADEPQFDAESIPSDDVRHKQVDEHVSKANQPFSDESDAVSEIGKVRFDSVEEDEKADQDAVETGHPKKGEAAAAEFTASETNDWDAEPAKPEQAAATADTLASDVEQVAASESGVPKWADRHLGHAAASRLAKSKSEGSDKPETTRLPYDIDQSEIPSGPITVGTLPMLPWQDDLEALISRIEQELASTKSDLDGDRMNEHIRRHAHLRLLYLMAQRQEQALTAIPSVDNAQQEYWQQLLWAMSNSLDTAQFPDEVERAAKTVPPLSGALRQMREQAGLSIKNMTFCRKISYFGNYERFPRNEFTPGHEVLLYAEVENFVSAMTADGEYRTSLKSLIEIKDSEGQIVWTKGFPSTEDFCRNPRRDYFHNYQFYIPEGLSTGAYTLKLTIVDELSKKRASNSLSFVLK